MAPAVQEGRGTGADPGDVRGHNCSGVVTFLTENGGGKTEDELKS